MREHVFGAKDKGQPLTDADSAKGFSGKRVLVVGMARSGIAVAELLCREGAVVIVNDMKPRDAFGDQLDVLRGLPITWRLGEDGLALLDGCDCLVISPGVPIDAPIVCRAQELGIPVLGEMEMASRCLSGALVAVTGTNGKTTTVTLIGLMFEQAGKRTHVAGNIGYPLSSAALKSREGDMTVAEVSSFQLETTGSFHPLTAAVLNITEDHLNRHGTMERYTALKKHIFDMQTALDRAVLNADDAACRDMAKGLRASILWFSRTGEVENGAFVRENQIVFRQNGEERTICGVDEVRIPGPHNLENALAAVCVAISRGVPPPVVRHALKTFSGVEHRIEFTRELDGVRYINDSKGTNTDSTIKAVQTMRAPTVIILGGYDKHVSFAPLAKEIAASPFIAHCVLMGATASQIETALREAGYDRITRADSMKDAVDKSRTLAVAGGNVLLSPACASFDMFSDYEARGRIFKQIVSELD